VRRRLLTWPKSLRELALVRQQLASLVNAAAQGDQPANNLAQLTEREQALQKRLGQLGGQQETVVRWIELNEVRKNIPKDAVLVELAMIYRYDFHGPTRSQAADLRYVAWVIPPAGESEVRFVELGPENLITEAIRDFLKLSDTSAQQILELGEKEAERRMAAALEKGHSTPAATVGKTSRTKAALDYQPRLVRLGGPLVGIVAHEGPLCDRRSCRQLQNQRSQAGADFH